MERGDQKHIGNARAEIATRIVRLQSEYYGTDPTEAKAYITEDVVVVVLQATGRVVRAFLSETNLEADVSVEFFLLGEARTDMHGFEPGPSRPG
jgi:uncharacterized protein YbcI